MKPVCDFCNSTEPVWNYPADDFPMAEFGGVLLASRGNWLACGPCSDLIEAADSIGLTQRSARLYVERNELGSANAIAIIAEGMAPVHATFLEQHGPRELI